MILTDEEIDAFLSNPSMHIQARIIYRDFARAVEAAILQKLASAELPEPAIFQYDAMLASPIKAYTAAQLRQAYAQGAASQLDRLEKAEKDAERYRWLVASHWYVGPEPDGDLEGVSWNDHNCTADGVTQAIDCAMEASK